MPCIAATAPSSCSRADGSVAPLTIFRTSNRVTLAAYLGGSDKFDNAIAEFAEAYADENERDYAALAAAVVSGRAHAQSGL